MKKIMLIFGTRPEAIKMAPIINEIQSRNGLQCLVCVTAQHREMLDQVLEVFNINPDYDLDIMQPNQSLCDITAKVLVKLEEVIKVECPDLILVHGDTTTTLVGGLAAYYNKIKLGHVEAGLRSYNKYSPFPEEMNRNLVSVLADIHFAPTTENLNNLILENISKEQIVITGNTAIDALKTTVSSDYYNEHLEWASDSNLLLLTVHRRETQGLQMVGIFQAINRIVLDYPNVKVIYPVHLSPAVRDAAKVLEGNDRIRLIEPLNVIDFHNFINQSYLVLTDSGGIQEEAPSLNKPVIVLRDVTERTEGISANTLKLATTDEHKVYQTICELLDNQDVYDAMSQSANPYGDGFASVKIVDAIEKFLDK